MNDQYPLSDEQIDRIQEAAYRELVAGGYNGGMVGETWDRASGRAVATAAVEAERQRREGEDFENSLEAHHRAELGLRPKLPKGHHYYVAHPLAQVEIRKDSAIPEDRAALAEECKRVAHHLFDISPEAEDMVHLSMAIDRLAASPPPPQPAWPTNPPHCSYCHATTSMPVWNPTLQACAEAVVAAHNQAFRYPRELRKSIEQLEAALTTTPKEPKP